MPKQSKREEELHSTCSRSANKPVLMYGFDQLGESGITEMGVILGPLQEGIVQALGDGSKFGVKITYVEQPDPKGIPHAVPISRKSGRLILHRLSRR